MSKPKPKKKVVEVLVDESATQTPVTPVPVVPVNTPSTHVRIINKMTQLLTITVANNAGVFSHVGLSSKGSVKWPRQPSYGADVDAKLRKGLISIVEYVE